jgi:transcriptional regulator with XRE-family HTH domain
MEKDVNKLQAVRKAAGMTQQQLAEKSGVSYSLICKFESGERSINLAGASRLTNLCKALGCRMRDIVTDPRIIDWDENTPPALKALQVTLAEAEAEHDLKQAAGMLKELRDERNGIKPEPKPVVKRTTEKVKKTITMEVEFPADFMPPDEFDFDDWNSKCSLCPFYVDATDYGTWCQHPECGEDNSCPLKKYF